MDESQRHCLEEKKLDTHKTKNCMILLTWSLLMGGIIFSVRNQNNGGL